jgi:hypothetical protein
MDEKIIYDLLFGDKEEYRYNLSFLDHIEDYPDFTNPIIEKVNRGRVDVLTDRLEVNDEGIFWVLKIKRI